MASIDTDDVLEGELVDDPAGEDRERSREQVRSAASGERIAKRTLVGRIFDDACLLLIALRDPRTGTAPKLAVVAMIVYLISPVDLVPDVAPLLGITDDALIVPLMAQGALRLLPRDVRDAAQQRVDTGEPRRRALRWFLVAIAVWLVSAALFTWLMFSAIR